MVSQIAARRHPGQDGHEGRVVRAGQFLRITQSPKAAR
jgi:hypothetical protein